MSYQRFERYVFLSDMDGTLTPSRQPMTAEFAEIFSDLVLGCKFYIVTGSDIEKIKEQIPSDIIEKISGIFASMGNEFYVRGNRISKNDFIPEESMIAKLEEYVKNTKYPYTLYPNHIEKRCGMVNFCVIGRDCPLEERFRYQIWDNENEERKAIALELSKLYPKYSFEIGGAISIDIVPTGFGKVQVASKLKEMYPGRKIIFFGDRTDPGGNDYEIAKKLVELGNAEIVKIENPTSVLDYLKSLQ